MNNTEGERLFKLLDQAQQLSGEYTGGYSYYFSSAQEFHATLTQCIQKLKEGDDTQLKEMHIWFAPTCDWDDLVGMDGVGLGNEIYELLTKMKG